MSKELKEGYIKIQYDLAPKTNGKKFATWCEKYGFTPLNGGRRAWSSGLGTYLRDASGVGFSDGEMFLFYEEELINVTKLTNQKILEVLERLEREKVTYTTVLQGYEGQVEAVPLSAIQELKAEYGGEK